MKLLLPSDICLISLLELANFPAEWKVANVVAVFKKGKKSHAENYCPISLFSILSKNMERYIFNGVRERISSHENPV